MIAIEFGNFCFNSATSEQNILAVIAPKNKFASLDDFITAALKFMESDEKFYDNWTELYKNRTSEIPQTNLCRQEKSLLV